jgi:hypothetical protein
MPFRLSLPALALVLVQTLPSNADTIADALQAAVDAYEAGDLATTSEQLTIASTGVSSKRSEELAAFLPEAPDGWTRTVNPDFASSLAMLGGGSGVETVYSDASGGAFTLTVIADSPMVSSLLPMFADETVLAAMGKVIDVPGAKILDQDQSLMAVIGERMMVQASGMETAAMLPIVSKLDFEGLATLLK